MNTCPGCELLISEASYNFCPFCGKILRELCVAYPAEVYSRIEFSLSIKLQGIHPCRLSSVTVHPNLILLDSDVTLNPGQELEFNVLLDQPGLYDLIICHDETEQHRTIKCVALSSGHLVFQNNQVVDLGISQTDREIYVSREIQNHDIVVDEATLKCLHINHISLYLDGFEYSCTKKQDNCFEIVREFFETLNLNNDGSGFISLVTIENHKIIIGNIRFKACSYLPDFRIIHNDYVNQNPLNEENKQISFTLTYDYDNDVTGNRPVNKVRVNYLSPFAENRPAEYFFDDNQRIRLSVSLDMIKAAKYHNNIQSKAGSGLEIKVSYNIAEIDHEFCSLFYIPFIIRQPGDIPVEPESYISIDFGTTNTCIAYLRKQSSTIELFNLAQLTGTGIESDFIPTVLKFKTFSSNNSHVIEYASALNELDTPLTFAANFKPRLPRDEELFYFDLHQPVNICAFKPSKLTKLFLGHLFDKLSNNLGYRPGQAIISFPATFNQATINGLYSVIENLGLTPLKDICLTEPENVALYYAFDEESKIRQKLNEKGFTTICVFDCGGGTTDISVVKISLGEGIIFEILATWGTDSFSGNYLTYMMLKQDYEKQDWFPKDFSVIYTAKNEDLKAYFSNFPYYEIKKKSITKDDKIFKKIKKEIQAQFAMVNSTLLKLNKAYVLDFPHTDFFILAGNSCLLDIFKQEAEEHFSQSEIIYEPETGKKAVAKGAFKAYEMYNSIRVKGTSLSQNEYWYRFNFDLMQIFNPWLDMNVEHLFTSVNVLPRPVPVLSKAALNDAKLEPIIRFTIPAPDNMSADKGVKYKFRLKFHNSIIYYAWVKCNGDNEESTEYKEIYTERK